MKKKLLTTTLALSLFASVGTAAFAESGNTTISTVEQLKSAVAEDASDGYFSEAEKTALLEQTTDEVVSALVSEKLDAAADLLNGQEITAEMQKLPGGTEKAVYTYDLGDNCELVVELLDRAELAGMESGIMPMATSGSSDVWKDYGNRYFTAKASVKCKYVLKIQILHLARIFKAFRLSNIQTLCIFPCFCPYQPKQGKFFTLRSQPYPRALRKSALPPSWRGRRCSWWYLRPSVQEAPAHLSVLRRQRAGCSCRCVGVCGNENPPIPQPLPLPYGKSARLRLRKRKPRPA